MDVSSLLTDGAADHPRDSQRMSNRASNRGGAHVPYKPVPNVNQPKKVSFELLLDEGSKTRARIPMRVLINANDTIDSIVTTVKNFYGIYEGHGVSFEDEKGNTLIARYDNLGNDMVVYVRTVSGPVPAPNLAYQTQPGVFDVHRTSLGEPFQMLPPNADYAQSPSRPLSRLAQKRSISPHYGRGRRSASQQQGGYVSNTASRGSSANGSYLDDAMNGYSDSDGGQSSIAGTKRARSEQFASAEISLENVLKDGRRTGPSFESSELPLFVPPQVPITNSTSSISPQRRNDQHEPPVTFARPLYPYHAQLLPSPQQYMHNGQTSANSGRETNLQSAPAAPQHGHRLRDRSANPSDNYRRGARAGYTAQGVLPTPDPTVASCISDEDVARQLIALGDASNFSMGRTSASTLNDDAFSGVADAASSTGATSESEDYSDDGINLPNQKRHRAHDADEYEDQETIIKHEYDDYEGDPRTKKIKTKAFDGSARQVSKTSSSLKLAKSNKSRANTFPKTSKASGHLGLMKAPTAPASNGLSNKSSSSSTLNFQHQLSFDEEDLSSKPRCQRCRKSKKGCDRQRPCQRCKDAGIGVEGCVSEDEGNGRKGRFGRHMGVPVKNNGSAEEEDDYQAAGAILSGMAGADNSPDKSKKRKR